MHLQIIIASFFKCTHKYIDLHLKFKILLHAMQYNRHHHHAHLYFQYFEEKTRLQNASE